jgi:hypothetical protein
MKTNYILDFPAKLNEWRTRFWIVLTLTGVGGWSLSDTILLMGERDLYTWPGAFLQQIIKGPPETGFFHLEWPGISPSIEIWRCLRRSQCCWGEGLAVDKAVFRFLRHGNHSSFWPSTAAARWKFLSARDKTSARFNPIVSRMWWHWLLPNLFSNLWVYNLSFNIFEIL